MRSNAAMAVILGTLVSTSAWSHGPLSSFGPGRGRETGVRNGVEVPVKQAAAMGIVQVVMTYAPQLPNEPAKLIALLAAELGGSYQYACTGSLVAARHVLTAAHCVSPERSDDIAYEAEAPAADAKAEIVDLERGPTFRLVYKLQSIEVRRAGSKPVSVSVHSAHPDFKGLNLKGFMPDVAVLELDEELPKPYLSISPNRPEAMKPFVLAGFGDDGTQAGIHLSDPKFRVGFNVASLVQDNEADDATTTRKVVVTGVDHAYDKFPKASFSAIDNGDSGGPLTDVLYREIVGVASAVEHESREVDFPMLDKSTMKVGVLNSYYIDLSDPKVRSFLEEKLPASAFTGDSPDYLSFAVRQQEKAKTATAR